MGRAPGGAPIQRGSPYLGSARASSVRRRAPTIEGRASTPSRSNAATRSAMAAPAAARRIHRDEARQSLNWRNLRSEPGQAQHRPQPRPATPTAEEALPTHPVQPGESCGTLCPSVNPSLGHFLLPRSWTRIPAKLPRLPHSQTFKQASNGERGLILRGEGGRERGGPFQTFTH